MSVNSKMTALADAIRAKANCSDTLSIDEMTNKVLSIPTGSSLEIAGINLYGSGLFTVYYTSLQNGEMVSTSVNADMDTYIVAVVGTYISVEGACGVDDGNNILEGIEQNVNGYTKWKVINSGNETVYLMELPESSGIETCYCNIIHAAGVDFSVEYVAYEADDMDVYHLVPKRNSYSETEAGGYNIYNIVKGAVLKVFWSGTCEIGYSDDSRVMYDTYENGYKCYYIEVNGYTELSVYH